MRDVTALDAVLIFRETIAQAGFSWQQPSVVPDFYSHLCGKDFRCYCLCYCLLLNAVSCSYGLDGAGCARYY